MPYMLTFTINIPPMLAYIPYMDPMGIYIYSLVVWNMFFPYIGNFIIPTDELHHFSEG